MFVVESEVGTKSKFVLIIPYSYTVTMNEITGQRKKLNYTFVNVSDTGMLY